MMNDFTAALARIEAGLEDLGRRVLLNALRPGIGAERTRSLLRGGGLSNSAQVEALYSWRDGTDTVGVGALGDIYLFPGFYFLSLEDVVANYRAFISDRRWMPGWLPILANGGSDFYFLDLSSEMNGVVRHFRIEEIEYPVEVMTIGDMLRTIAYAFDRGLFVVADNGYLEMDDLAFGSLAAELNPRVSWWVD